ncbi:tubulin-tyrosine ligase [Microthyrium microscopicum]|uniref:Tubulin-tyrosine ligase n=1 Tax=Microthyrium microscopicum TaxID=703497 RepID=A0A6A6U3U4_9PEZI|nr:tubulin-tyrosine ligase [Microthyrium microscopicum]
MPPKFYAQIAYNDPYVQPLIESALSSRLPPTTYKLISTLPTPLDLPVLQFLQYEDLAFELALTRNDVLINAYVIRKALLRKHFLNATVVQWAAKHPQSVLRRHVKVAVELEVDYAEYLDEALAEAYELRESLEGNEDKGEGEREWWILKPSMADRAHGVRLFGSEEELRGIFEGWEADMPDSDEEEEDDEEVKGQTLVGAGKEVVYASQLRHFVAQLYIHPPLLLPSAEGRKFHVRTYVLSVGALKVYVYRPMLALFAAGKYVAPGESLDLRVHLTNTCVQGTDVREGSVRRFWELEEKVEGIEGDWKEKAWAQICVVTGELFEAAGRNMLVNFQAVPSSFEIFGLDFLVDQTGTAWLLEVNAFPDFKQTGDDLKDVVQGLFEDTVDVAIKPFFSEPREEPPKTLESGRMVQVLDIDLGRR